MIASPRGRCTGQIDDSNLLCAICRFNLKNCILLRDKLATNVVIRATEGLTCNATMLRDKLKKNVARITEP